MIFVAWILAALLLIDTVYSLWVMAHFRRVQHLQYAIHQRAKRFGWAAIGLTGIGAPFYILMILMAMSSSIDSTMPLIAASALPVFALMLSFAWQMGARYEIRRNKPGHTRRSKARAAALGEQSEADLMVPAPAATYGHTEAPVFQADANGTVEEVHEEHLVSGRRNYPRFN